MAPEQIIGKTVDHIFDVEGEDGTFNTSGIHRSSNKDCGKE